MAIVIILVHLNQVPPLKSLSNTFPPYQHQTNMSRNNRELQDNIPQLDGGTSILPEVGLKNKPTKVQMCNECKKTFETDDDIKWHFGTKIGREDCLIFRSMIDY